MPSRAPKLPKTDRLPRYRRGFYPLLQALVAACLFVAAAIIARAPEVSEFEIELYIAITSWPAWLFPLFYAITQVGNVITLFALVAIQLVRNKYHIVLRLLLTGCLAYVLSGITKDLYGRARPAELLDNVAVLDYSRGPGFPSGHTALATAIALTLFHYAPPKYRPIMVLVIVLVGLSRVYLGVHMPLDIIGGFAIGWGAYALFRNVALRDVRR